MEKVEIKSYGKINLCLDVLGRLDNGYHQVEMVMQQISLHDDVMVRWYDCSETREPFKEGPIKIEVSTNRPYLPKDQRNLAYKAAIAMTEQYGQERSGKVRIDIKKRIPVAAGLAGGSSNCAAVLHAVNRMWHLGLTVEELCRIGSALGSDVPFSIMGQAKCNPCLGLEEDPLSTHCAVARGTGTELTPIQGLESWILLTKPPIAVSTGDVYKGLDLDKIEHHPNTGQLAQGLKEKKHKIVEKNMINVLENFTLTRYPNVMYTKNNVKQILAKRVVLMSGSGPTIFALCETKEEAKRACKRLIKQNKETFWTNTTY